MTGARVAGRVFEFQAKDVRRALSTLDPEPIVEHYVIVDGRRYPVKQVLSALTGLDRADFTSHQARAILARLGFGVYRRADGHPLAPPPSKRGPQDGKEASVLTPYLGRWIAQDGLEVLFDADSPEAVIAWIRRHRRRARVWRVPSSPVEAGGDGRCTLIVAYTELPDDAGGHPRPLLDLVVAEMDDVLIPCLVDSGALNTLVPRWVATAAGIDVPIAR